MWILIILGFASGNSATHIEFSSQQACINAKVETDKLYKEIWGITYKTVCVQK